MKGLVRLSIGLFTLGTLGVLAQDPGPVTIVKGKTGAEAAQDASRLLLQEQGGEPIVEIKVQDKTIEEIVAILRQKSGL